MAGENVIASAFVRLSPDVSGFEGEATAGIGGVVGKIAGALGALGPGGAAVGGVLAGAGAIGAAFVGIGEKFEGARNQIAVATGATGADLDRLDDNFKKVFASSASSMGDAAKAVGFLAERTGLAGAPLDDLAKKELDLARITKTDLGANLEASTAVFGKFGVAAGDQSAALDVLFKAAQNAGRPVTDLTEQLKSSGTVLQQFGFGLDQSAALLSSLDKAGVNTDSTMAALKKAFATFSKDGVGPTNADLETLTKKVEGADKAVGSAQDALTRVTTAFDVQKEKAEASGKTWSMNASQTLQLEDAQKKLKDAVDAQSAAHDGLAQAQSNVGKSSADAHTRLLELFTSIKGAKTDTDAMGLAVHDLGARAGGELVAAIRSGKLNIDDLTKSLGDGKGGIEATSRETETLGTKITRLKNEALVALEPVARRVLDGLTTGFEAVGRVVARVEPVFIDLKNLFMEAFGLGGGLLDNVNPKLSVLEQVAVYAGRAVRSIYDGFKVVAEYFEGHTDQLKGGLIALGVVLATIVLPPLIATAASAIATAAPFIALGVAAFAVGAGAVYLYTHFKIVREIVEAVKLEFQFMWHLLQDDVWPALQAVGRFIENDVVPALEGFWHGVETVVGAVGRFAEAIPGAISAAVGFITGLPGQALSALQALPGLLGNLALDAIHAMGYAFGFAIGEVIKFFIDLPANLVKAVELLIKANEWLVDVGLRAIRGLADAIVGAAPAVWNFFIGLPGQIVSFVGNAATWLVDTGWHVLNGMLHGIETAFVDIFNFFTGLPGQIMRIIGDLGHLLYDAGKDVLAGLLHGIADAASHLGGPLAALGSGIVGGIRDALGAKSPALALMPVGADVVDGVVVGIQRRTSTAADAMRALGATIAGVGVGGSPGSFGAPVAALGGSGAPVSAAQRARDMPGNHDRPIVEQNFHIAQMSPGEVARLAADEAGWVLKTAGG